MSTALPSDALPGMSPAEKRRTEEAITLEQCYDARRFREIEARERSAFAWTNVARRL
jgi:hypothetical protein